MNINRAPVAARGLALAALVATAVSGPAAQAAPGDLDPRFGSDGIVVVDQGVEEWAYDTVVQPDGKIIGVGNVYGSSTNNDALVFRLNADGTRDQRFGLRTLDGPGGGEETAYGVALQRDGKIVVAGRTTKNENGAVWRLLPSGARDLTFGGGDGFVPVDSGGAEYLIDVAVAPDGRIVVAGSTSVGSQATVYRLTPTGEPDKTFDTDGALGLGDPNSRAQAVAVQRDGKVVVTGQLRPDYGMTVRRLTTSGAPDPGFGGGDGEATSPLEGDAYDLVLQPDGRIVVAGRAYDPDGSDAWVLRYTAAGMVDGSFGPGGEGAMVDLGDYEEFGSVALTPRGGIVATGWSEAGYDPLVVKLDARGRLDPAFGKGGAVELPGSMQYGEAIAVQPDGHVLVVGGDEKRLSSVVVYRLLGDFVPVPALKCQGRPATILGTPGRDRLAGTGKADVIVALGGADVIRGLGGNDLVCAGDGDDTVLGGPGKDVLRGERGRDRLVGGTGKDRLAGGPQQDTVAQ